MSYVVAYVVAAIVFLGADFIWLSRVANGFYRQHIGSLLLDQPNFAAAGAFYLLYIAGIVYFAVAPALAGGGLTTALIAGALLGLLAYGTYDMTNLSTLKNWSVTVAVVDIAWGTFLTGLAAVVSYYAVARLFSQGV
ncbi:MAG: DUF2177 family protein [Rhodobiaceae bacterium]|nr:DUF2177 family protein [Rhodobiaceae bacterium]MCC0056541.1 DUF2177 family protein [Rhodobiaceae bacterium]